VSKTIDFQHVCDEFLLFAARNCDGSEYSFVGAHFFCGKHFPEVPEGWRTEIAVKLAKDGLGSSRNNGESDQEFFINSDGLIRAKEIEKSKAPKSFFDKVRDIPRSDWISIGAFLVSIIALFN
jgi:hypothetical protein